MLNQTLRLSFGLMCTCAVISCAKKEKCTKVGTGSDGKPIMQCSSDSKGATAAAAVKQYVEAYAQWSMRSATPCPNGFSELAEFTNRNDAKDPWGHDYVFFCGGNVPAGAGGFAVISIGPDGQQGTADDIKSW